MVRQSHCPLAIVLVMAATDEQWLSTITGSPKSPLPISPHSPWTSQLQLAIHPSASPSSSAYSTDQLYSPSPFSLPSPREDDDGQSASGSFLLVSLSPASLPLDFDLDACAASSMATSPLSLPTLSFPASGHPATTPPLVSAASLPTRKRRRRAPPAVAKSHKEIDALRRAKEEAVLRRMEELTAHDTAAEDNNTEQQQQRQQSSTGKKKKLRVLQAGVDKIEQLQALVRRLTEAANARDESVQSLACHLCSITAYYTPSPDPLSASSSSALSLLPVSTARGLSVLDSQHALYSSLFIRGRCAMMLQEIGTRTILDANESHSTAHIDRLPAS